MHETTHHLRYLPSLGLLMILTVLTTACGYRLVGYHYPTAQTEHPVTIALQSSEQPFVTADKQQSGHVNQDFQRILKAGIESRGYQWAEGAATPQMWALDIQQMQFQEKALEYYTSKRIKRLQLIFKLDYAFRFDGASDADGNDKGHANWSQAGLSTHSLHSFSDIDIEHDLENPRRYLMEDAVRQLIRKLDWQYKRQSP